MIAIVTKDTKTGSNIVTEVNYRLPKYKMGDHVTISYAKEIKVMKITEIHMGVEYNGSSIVTDIYYVSGSTLFSEEAIIDSTTET